jgi:hypothetical protein
MKRVLLLLKRPWDLPVASLGGLRVANRGLCVNGLLRVTPFSSKKYLTGRRNNPTSYGIWTITPNNQLLGGSPARDS